MISSPPETHFEIINKVLKFKSIKFIVCEKPFTNSLENARVLNKNCKKNNIKLFINYQRNSSVITKKILEDISCQNIKFPVTVTHWYSDSLENSCSHFIALFNKIFGQVLVVKNFSDNGLNDNPQFNLKYENADINFIPLSFPYTFNGFKMYFKNGVIEYLNNGIEVVRNDLTYSKIRYPEKQIIDQRKTTFENDFFKSQMSFTNELYNALINKKALICSGEDGVKVWKIIKKLKSYD